MSAMTVPLAHLVALLLESLLNGAFFTLFIVLILLLFHQTVSTRFHRIVFGLVACLMMLLSATHLVLSFVRAVQAFIPRDLEHANPDRYYDSIPGSPLEIAKACIFVAQTLLGDGVMIWRCYVVFDKSRIVLLLSCAPLIFNLVFGIIITMRFGQSRGYSLPQERFYLSAFTSATFIVNISCSWAIVYRIWRSSKEMRDLSKFCPVMCAVIQSGVLYAAGTLTLLISCVVKSNGVYTALDIVVPLAGIVFSLIALQIQFQLHIISLSRLNFAADRTSNLRTLGTLPRWQHYFSSSTEHQQCQPETINSTPDSRHQLQRLSTYSRGDYIDRESLSSGADARLKGVPLER